MKLLNAKARNAIYSFALAVAVAVSVGVEPFIVQFPRSAEGQPQVVRKPSPKPPRPVAHDETFARLQRFVILERWGLPDCQFIRSREGHFIVGMPDRTRCPRWVMEFLDADSLEGKADRDDDEWRADPNVPVEWRATDKDYRNSDFERGHGAASRNHKRSEQEQAATFVLSNAMPQTKELNNGLMRELEDHIYDRVKAGEVAWVLTLPIWMRDAQNNICARTIGAGVWVPTHCAKAVLWAPDRRRSLDVQTLKLECWILPNDEKNFGALDEYKISGDKLEAIAGSDLFAALPDDVEKKLESVPD